SSTDQKKGARSAVCDQTPLDRWIRQSVSVHCSLHVAGAMRSESPKQSDDLADDLHGRATRIDDDGRHGRMLGLEHHPLTVALESLDGGLGLARLRLDH